MKLRDVIKLPNADDGDSPEEVERLMTKAIPLHIESLRSHGEPVPQPQSAARYVAV
jgi:predicted RNase H-like HicB family nuclease